MLYRPNFCANCGEKVERTEWTIFTSRRFCPVCESEFKGHDLIPRAVVAAGLVIGLLGVGTYMGSGSVSPAPVAFRQPSKAVPAGPQPQPTQAPSSPPPARGALPQTTTPGTAPTRQTAQGYVPRYEATDDTYICGAETKKGTPCSRRVKGNVRCYQHKGMPAMLAPDKLKIG